MKKKFKFSIKDFLNKKENLAIMAVAFVFCAGLIVTNMKSGDIPPERTDGGGNRRRRGRCTERGCIGGRAGRRKF